jgi:hypothetical protein
MQLRFNFNASFLKLEDVGSIPITTRALIALAFAAILAAAFLNGVRFRYESISGKLWRVDEFTGQRCRVLARGADCAPLTSLSTSTSVSVSVSTSTSVTLAHRQLH